MIDHDPPLQSLERLDGYLPIEDHGLISDGSTAALVGRDGAISWLCVPRFDGDALFSAILDRERGGSFTVQPEGLRRARQRYVEDTMVLRTELEGSGGTIEITDALTLRSGADLNEDVPSTRSELVRRVRVLHGDPRVAIDVNPRGGAEVEPLGGGLALRCSERPDLDLQLHATVALDGPRTQVDLREGGDLRLSLRWGHVPYRHRAFTSEETLAATVDAWRRWISCFHYEGPQSDLVRRSAITLKALDHFENGAIVAAPTSSLPEEIGGVRNWDYRYAWIRDCAFSVYALRRIGLVGEAEAFLAWALDAAERHGGPKVMYDLDGEMCPEEQEDGELEGYRSSPPVRWGNDAAFQRQNDVYGELLDVAWQWAAGGGEIDEHLWTSLRNNVDAAAEAWDVPDHGIWEVRTPGRLFTYSVAMCQVALDRGARIADLLGRSEDSERWRDLSEELRSRIVEGAWDEETGSFTEHIGEPGALDASLLTLPLRRVLPADHPRMVATCAAVTERLGAGDGLIYRYLPEESPDGLPGEEGAFLLCSFWLVDNLAHQGRLDEAQELYDSLCDRANPLGLLPEQIDPDTGRFLGNFPQAFSHVGVISSGINLARRHAEREDGG
jgi:alpha,alpha-trehalase